MKKGKSRIKRFSGPILLLLLLTVNAPAQEPASWTDGNPVFTKTKPGDNVLISDVITLAPQNGLMGADEILNYQLYGLEWSWPSNVPVVAAEDIDARRVGDQELYLVTDALGRRVFEINARTASETFTFPPKQSSGDPTDPKYLNKPVDAFIFNENNLFKVVITDQDRNRVIKINKESSKIEWQYGDPNYREGSGLNQLKQPEDAERIPDTNEYIIADKGNNRVIIVDEATNTIQWTMGPEELNSPVDVQYVNPGKILITDRGNHRVILVDRTSRAILRSFGTKGVADTTLKGLNLPIDADYLTNDHIIIADGGNNRILEIDAADKVVWQFHRRLTSLRDVDRLDDGHTLVITDNYPSRLAYTDSFLVSKIYDFGENRESDFDQISWQADTLAAVTSVRFQLRSANSLGDLDKANWYGPSGTSNYYNVSGSSINTIHDGHRFYQFRANLLTRDPLKTPKVTNVQIKHHYYRIGQEGYFYTPFVMESEGRIISKWKTLTFKAILPNDPLKRDKINLEIRIHDAVTKQRIERFVASPVSGENIINLDNIPALNQVQSIYLLAYMSTLNASVSPVLDAWTLDYQYVPSANSSITFTDKKGYDAPYYRATTVLPAQEDKVDSCYILLKDTDLEVFQSEYKVKVFAAKSRDSVEVSLKLQPLGGLFSRSAIPILISTGKDPANQILEVQDRDMLRVTYRDSYNSLDVSRDSILVIQNTTGKLYIEDSRGTVLKQTVFGDQLYFHIKEENDRNINPQQKDTITLTVYDRTTMDEEVVTLSEVPSGDGRYDTGEFISTTGLLVFKDNNGARHNSRIESMAGHRITAEYVDNLPLVESVTIPADTGSTGNVSIYFGRQPYVVEVAPNPYHKERNGKFSLRVASSTGTLQVRKIEIFNLSGELVRDIQGSELRFDTGLPVPKDKYGVAENWWDLKNSSSQYVASGTYWAKVHADLVTDGAGTVEQVAFFRKFVVVQ